MKIGVFITLCCALMMLQSCSSSNDVASNGLLQKRKYRQGFHSNVMAKIKGQVKKQREVENEPAANELDSAIASADNDAFKWWESANAMNQHEGRNPENNAKPIETPELDPRLDRPILRYIARADKHDSVLSKKLRDRVNASSSSNDPRKDGIISLVIAGVILMFGIGIPLINIVAACFGLYYGIRANKGGEKDLGLAGIIANAMMIAISLFYTIIIAFYLVILLVSFGVIFI